MGEAAPKRQLLPDLHGEDVGEDAKGDTGDDRGTDEDDRHERRHPERVGLHRPEDETGVAVQEAGDRDARPGEFFHRPLVRLQRLVRDVPCAEGEDREKEAAQPVYRAWLRQCL